MKKAVVLLMVFLWCTAIMVSAAFAADQVGIPMRKAVTPHGHSGSTDGGVINLPIFKVGLFSFQAVTCGTDTKLNVIAKDVDNKSWFDVLTNRYTPKIPGNYLFIAQINATASTTFTGLTISIKKNGVTHGVNQKRASFTVGQYSSEGTVTIVPMNGTTDYVEAWGIVSGSGTCEFQNPTVFQGMMISR